MCLYKYSSVYKRDEMILKSHLVQREFYKFERENSEDLGWNF